jgi:hypothetical protein
VLNQCFEKCLAKLALSFGCFDEGVDMGEADARPQPEFVNLLRSPGIDSQPGGPVRQPYLTYRPAQLHSLAESIPGLLTRLQIRAQVRYCTFIGEPCRIKDRECGQTDSKRLHKKRE